MELRITEPSRLFIATGGGAGLNFEHPCPHGAPAISLHLFSEQNGMREDLGVVLPHNAAAALFGAAIAYYAAAGGSDAGEKFLAEMLDSRDSAAQILATRSAAYKAAKAACCEASVFTGGREHTCRPADPS